MLLVVAAQAGFVDGPRVLSNMAVDSWVPHRFAALSDRLTTQNGIFLMGAAAMAALFYTQGNVGHLVVMYSINVFLTCSLSMFAMFRFWLRHRRSRPQARRRLLRFGAALVLCVTILAVTVVEKFLQGGWVTVTITLVVVAPGLGPGPPVPEPEPEHGEHGERERQEHVDAVHHHQVPHVALGIDRKSTRLN